MKISSLLLSAFLALASGHYIHEETESRHEEPSENQVRSHHKSIHQEAGPRVHHHEGPRPKQEQTTKQNLLRGNPQHQRPRASTQTVDVVIVGSGMAGLSAAYDLKKAGWSVKILEAKERHGGRIYKNDMTFGFPIDIGAEWVHLEAATRDGVSGGFTHPNQLLSAITGNSPSQTCKKDPDDIYIWSEAENGQPAENERDDSESQDWRWVGSTWYDFMKNEIMDKHGVEDDIMLNCPVNHIWYGNWDTGVEVYCDTTTTGAEHMFEASFVIVTVPMNILSASLNSGHKPAGSITFEPALPSAYASKSKDFKMGPGIKVWLEFDRTFWHGLQALKYVETSHNIENGNSADSWGQRVYFDEMWGHPNLQGSKHVIGMFAHGTGTAGELVDEDDDTIIRAILAELTEIYGVPAEDYHRNSFVQHWSTEKYIETGYTQYAPSSAMGQFQEPVNDVVYFAGEAIPPDSNDWGYAHAAAQSGKSAAYYIMAGRRRE